MIEFDYEQYLDDLIDIINSVDCTKIPILSIKMSAARYLFDPDEYPEGALTTKQEVIERINQYLKESHKEA